MRTDIRQFFRKNETRLTLLLVLCVMLLIFLLSAQPAEESTNTSDIFVLAFIKLFCRNFEALDSLQKAQRMDTIAYCIRKCAHVSEYMLLGVSLQLHMLSLLKRFRLSRPALISAAVGFFYAVSDELHQLAVSGRSAQFSDVLLDTFGILLGICFLKLFLRGRRKKLSSAESQHS